MSIVGYQGMITTRGRKIFRALRASSVIHEGIYTISISVRARLHTEDYLCHVNCANNKGLWTV